MSIVFYNYFENVEDNFYMVVKHNNRMIILNFKNGSYNISDINQIIDDSIQEKFNITENQLQYQLMLIDMQFLMIVEENWELQLDKNFMNLLGFSNRFLKEGYNRSNLTPNVDKVKFLKLYCNLVDNREDNEFLTNVL